MNIRARSALICSALCLSNWAFAAVESPYRYGGANILCKNSERLNEGLKHASMSAVLIIPAADYLDPSGGSIHLDKYELCKDNSIAPPDRYRVPPPTCSATMITPKRLITAAHCLIDPASNSKQQVDIKRVEVLANYVRPFENDSAKLEAQNVASMAKVLYCRSDLQTDLAVVELTKPLGEAHSPKRRPKPGESAHLISFPMGYPLAVETCVGAPGSCVQPKVNAMSEGWFRSPLDSFRGSSGGGVFADDGALIGVFRGGAPQLEAKPSCLAERVYSDSCAGDIASRVDSLPPELFNDSKIMSAVNCSFGEDPDWDPKCPRATMSAPLDNPPEGSVTGEAACSNSVWR